MRLICTLDDQKAALNFSEFLKREGIENNLEITGNSDWGSPDYGTIKCFIWVIEEDKLQEAQQWYEEFQLHPDNPVFSKLERWANPLLEPLQKIKEEIPLKVEQRKRARSAKEKGLGPITLYLLVTCVLLFMYGEITMPPIHTPIPPLPLTPLYTPPINKDLMYDYPKAYEILDKLVKAYGIENLQNLSNLPSEGRVLLDQFHKTPYWQGFYDYVVKSISHSNYSEDLKAPLFEKIQEGEIWRAVTPAFLHQNVFHLFFNMIWLVVLGKLIEDRLGAVRYLLFIILAAILSNTAQYLMSGSNFIGISGIITAMLGFIYARQRWAPWEGYSLSPGIISFMFFFILAMVGIQSISFLMEIFWGKTFVPGIANTAHVVGALTGYILGRTRAFNAPTRIKP